MVCELNYDAVFLAVFIVRLLRCDAVAKHGTCYLQQLSLLLCQWTFVMCDLNHPVIHILLCVCFQDISGEFSAHLNDCGLLFRRSIRPNPTNPKPNYTNHNPTKPANPNTNSNPNLQNSGPVPI